MDSQIEFSDFYINLIKLYSVLNFNNNEISKINKHISWYLADEKNNIIQCNNNNGVLFEIDINSAFPTICNCLLTNETEFLEKLSKLQIKKEKNILIATTYKGPTLKIFNQICKMIILGIVFDLSIGENISDIEIFEIKKDSVLCKTSINTLNRLKNLNSHNSFFTQFVLRNNFTFRITEFYKYFRSNKTSIFIDKTNTIIIKGLYKYIPPNLFNIITNILNEQQINYKDLLNIYSNKYLQIIKHNSLITLFNNYYLCNNNCVLNSEGRYEKYSKLTDINPMNYIKIFIFPILGIGKF